MGWRPTAAGQVGVCCVDLASLGAAVDSFTIASVKIPKYSDCSLHYYAICRLPAHEVPCRGHRVPTAEGGRRGPDKSLGNARPVHGWGLELLAAEMLESPGLVSQRQVQVRVRDPGGLACVAILGRHHARRISKGGYPKEDIQDNVPSQRNLC